MIEKVLVHTSEMWKEEGIIFFKINQPIIDLALLNEFHNVRCELCNGESYPDFHDMTEVKYVTKSAREYYADPSVVDFVVAGAVLINSKVVETLANYYLKFQKPIVPTRFFYCQEEAITWLHTFK